MFDVSVLPERLMEVLECLPALHTQASVAQELF
jgi:hypothetical protein